MMNELGTILFLACTAAAAVAPQGGSPAAAAAPLAVPAGWIENRGQWDPDIRYAITLGHVVVQLQRDGLRLLLPPASGSTSERAQAVRLELGETATDIAPCGLGRREEVYHFLLGRDEQRWRPAVPVYDVVRYAGVSPGVDVDVRRRGRGMLLRVTAPDAAALASLALRPQGPGVLRSTATQSASFDLGEGSLRLEVRGSWEAGGREGSKPSPCALLLDEDGSLHLHSSESLAGSPLVAEVALEWSTLLGGSSVEFVEALALTRDGGLVVGGNTKSFDFPVTPDALDTVYGGGTGTVPKDAYIARIDPSGRLLWATFLGGSNNEQVAGLVLRDDGSLVVGGDTSSSDFPTTPGSYSPEPSPLGNGFVCALTPSGDALQFSTFLGGNSFDQVNAVAVDGAGNLFLAGLAESTDFPTTPNALQTEGGGFPGADAFISRFNADASELTYSTYLGCVDPLLGSQARAMALTAEGDVVVAGTAVTECFPTTPGAYIRDGTGSDVFVAKIDPDSGQLLASTFLGINSSGLPLVTGVGVDGFGRVVVAGSTAGEGAFPDGAPSLDDTFNGMEDIYVAKLDDRLTTLLYGTFIGGSGPEPPWAFAVERSGAVLLAGRRDVIGFGFPTTPGAFQTTQQGVDSYVLRLSPDGQRLDYSTYFGGSKGENLSDSSSTPVPALVVGRLGEVTFGGYTTSTDLPLTPNALQDELNGFGDAFLARLSMLPTGTARFGAPSATEGASPYIGVSAMPAVGSDTFALTCSEAPAARPGFLLASARPADPPQPLGPADLWIDLDALLGLVPFQADVAGYGEVPLRLPDDPATAGVQACFQFVWPALPGQPPGASNALAVTVQP